MRHDMDLYPASFRLIKEKHKTVEMRLNDEKRQKIQVNDLVFFHNAENLYDVLRCKVIGLQKFKDFFELYSHYDPFSLGYLKGDIVSPEDMYVYYSKERIEQYGALAMEIEYLNDDYFVDGHTHLEYGPLNEEYVMEFVDAALKAGLDELDILDHTHRFKEFEPCYEHLRKQEVQDQWLRGETKFCNSLSDYYALIDAIRKKDLPLRVRFGLEVCYTSNTEDLLRKILKDVKLDFLTGSIHSVDSILYDMPFSKDLLWNKYEHDEVYKRYYEEVLALIRSSLFTRLGHPDQIKLFQYDVSYDLSQTYESIAAALYEQGMYGENNSGIHYRYHHPDVGLNTELLNTFKKHGVKLIAASDAHHPQDVGTDIKIVTSADKGVVNEKQSL